MLLEFFRKRKPLGVIGKDPTDPRDYKLSAVQPEKVALPETFNLRNEMGPVGSQNYGSCTSWGSTAVKEFWDNANLSEKFTYFNIKKISGIYYTQGDFSRNAYKALEKYGAPTIDLWPDDPMGSWEEYVHHEPPLSVYTAATQYRGGSYWRVDTDLESLRQAIYQNKCPVGVTSSWWSSHYQVEDDGYMAPPTGKKYGGHHYACVGWDTKGLWFRNSHGEDYGNDGYFYVPFDEYGEHDWWDYWVMLDLEGETEPVEGWVAGKYLEEAAIKFRPGDFVKPTVSNLNVRVLADLDSDVATQISEEDDLEVLDGPVFEDNYYWYRIKKIT